MFLEDHEAAAPGSPPRALDRGSAGIPIVGGVLAQGYPPGKVEAAARSILAKADGCTSVFTT